MDCGPTTYQKIYKKSLKGRIHTETKLCPNPHQVHTRIPTPTLLATSDIASRDGGPRAATYMHASTCTRANHLRSHPAHPSPPPPPVEQRALRNASQLGSVKHQRGLVSCICAPVDYSTHARWPSALGRSLSLLSLRLPQRKLHSATSTRCAPPLPTSSGPRQALFAL